MEAGHSNCQTRPAGYLPASSASRLVALFVLKDSHQIDFAFSVESASARFDHSRQHADFVASLDTDDLGSSWHLSSLLINLITRSKR